MKLKFSARKFKSKELQSGKRSSSSTAGDITEEQTGSSEDTPSQTRQPTLSTDDEDTQLFSDELMNVRLTIYSLSGITRHRDPKAKPSKSKSRATPQKKSKAPLTIPTTAVVSMTHGQSDSGFAMQTFLPSSELRCRGTNKVDGEERCTAYWRGDESTALLSGEDNTPSTLEMTLTMKREGFQTGMKVGQAHMYSHERIDVNVSIGKGKELIPLGVVSIVVSGEEEGEVVSNFSVKQENRPKKKTKKSVKDDPFVYDLDDSSTLRVGVQVIPKQEERDVAPKYLVEKFANENAILELNDENLLLEQLNLIENKPNNGVSELLASEPKSPQNSSNNFFERLLCGGLPTCFGHSFDGPTSVKAKPSASAAGLGAQPITTRRTTTEAHILPPHLLSDVSSKTFETWELTAFGDATADAHFEV